MVRRRSVGHTHLPSCRCLNAHPLNPLLLKLFPRRCSLPKLRMLLLLSRTRSSANSPAVMRVDCQRLNSLIPLRKAFAILTVVARLPPFVSLHIDPLPLPRFPSSAPAPTARQASKSNMQKKGQESKIHLTGSTIGLFLHGYCSELSSRSDFPLLVSQVRSLFPQLLFPPRFPALQSRPETVDTPWRRDRLLLHTLGDGRSRRTLSCSW